MLNRDLWRGRPVLVTGHTGFKGGWLTSWLLALGAKVAGFSLPAEGPPSFFEACDVGARCRSLIGDLRNLDAVRAAFEGAGPNLVFHLAAQPIVLKSFEDPVGTFATNVMGTAHVLEAARSCPSVESVVVITSDKCYENREWLWGYREDEALGGHDPYSASKGCAEIVTAAYRRSFGANRERKLAIASARAGNVFGGGDWAANRIIPDAARAVLDGLPLTLRNPGSVRPWQHVLDVLHGYLMLAERLLEGQREFESAWNFGPPEAATFTVAELADRFFRAWGKGSWRGAQAGPAPHEARQLKLDSSRARALLGWRPRLELDRALELTAEWYRGSLCSSGAGRMIELTEKQIEYVETTAAGARAS
ncbi:MAG: CDP-glucose 4,6-dehydratase [Candidatus Wallbacteria bacterium]|nr:CDP-glucose 4,6-dehydratase [Candidatus Wallbacteria bacterium]